jgi:hypothetical protein
MAKTSRGHKQDRNLFDFHDRRVSARDLDGVADGPAKHRTSEWRNIGYRTPCRFCFIFADDAECLRAAVITPHGHRDPELHFAFVGCGFDDFRARPSGIPVSKFALGRCDRVPVFFCHRSFVYERILER